MSLEERCKEVAAEVKAIFIGEDESAKEAYIKDALDIKYIIGYSESGEELYGALVVVSLDPYIYIDTNRGRVIGIIGINDGAAIPLRKHEIHREEFARLTKKSTILMQDMIETLLGEGIIGGNKKWDY
jgi:hypothetical protein